MASGITLVLTQQTRRWAATQARIRVGGVLSSLPRWLYHPADIAWAEYKPVQSEPTLARASGLSAPATLATNGPAEALVKDLCVTGRITTDVVQAAFRTGGR